MTPARDPIRWADTGSDVSGELAAALRTLRAEHGSVAQVEALGRRLGPQLAAPTLAGAGALLSPWIKAAGALLVSAALGLYVLTRPPRTEPFPEARPAPQQAPLVSPTVAAPALPTVQPASAPVSEQRVPARVAGKPRLAPVEPSTVSTPAPELELVLLQRSQAALDRDPSQALVLAEQHARDYPKGVFAQEREILAIEALLKLRRRPAALARAELFLQSHPESPHSLRVRALLERSRVLAPATRTDGTAHSMDVPVKEGGGHDPN